MEQHPVVRKLLADPQLSQLMLPPETYPLPEPYFTDKSKVKAILLGADPSNKSGGGETVALHYAFGVKSGINGYLTGILKNVQSIGLQLDDLYVQNLVRNYCRDITTDNKQWKRFASHWIDALREELDELDPSRTTPVLLTAKPLYEVLMHEDPSYGDPIYFYGSPNNAPIGADKNKLSRPLIPFFRGRSPRHKVSYSLQGSAWIAYREHLRVFFMN